MNLQQNEKIKIKNAKKSESKTSRGKDDATDERKSSKKKTKKKSTSKRKLDIKVTKNTSAANLAAQVRLQIQRPQLSQSLRGIETLQFLKVRSVLRK